MCLHFDNLSLRISNLGHTHITPDLKKMLFKLIFHFKEPFKQFEVFTAVTSREQTAMLASIRLQLPGSSPMSSFKTVYGHNLKRFNSFISYIHTAVQIQLISAHM